MTLLSTAVETAVSEVHKLVRTGGVPTSGKIRGDCRKFLDRFKSYSGSQISLQSNELHIYKLQPKSATKGEFFHIYLSLIVSSWHHGLQMANDAH